jgi:drug/metabolite transporter (DMT)-like permease
VPLALSLVVVAALIHATWNLMAKRAAHVGVAFVFAYNLVSCVVYAPWVGWVLAHDRTTWGLGVLACIAASGAIHLAYSLCLQRGYQLADLSVVYPVARGSGPLLSTLAAVLLLGEDWTPGRALGLAGVVGGILLISTGGRLAAFRRPAGQAGVRWGLVTGGLIASYTVVDAYGVKVLGIPPVVLDWFSSTLRLLLLLPVVLPRLGQARAAMRGHWGLAVGIGVLSPLGYILVLTALGMGAPVSVVAPMREMSMMVGALLGMLVLGERVTPARLAGCAVLMAGVVLLGR